MAADGSVSPVLKLRQVTDQGRITGLDSFRPILNSRGEVAVWVWLNNGPATIAILTPAAPE
jgi:hypothetical protein